MSTTLKFGLRLLAGGAAGFFVSFFSAQGPCGPATVLGALLMYGGFLVFCGGVVISLLGLLGVSIRVPDYPVGPHKTPPR